MEIKKDIKPSKAVIFHPRLNPARISVQNCA